MVGILWRMYMFRVDDAPILGGHVSPASNRELTIGIEERSETQETAHNNEARIKSLSIFAIDPHQIGTRGVRKERLASSHVQCADYFSRRDGRDKNWSHQSRTGWSRVNPPNTLFGHSLLQWIG
eukprot:scaffold5359_cov111-Cylindrotheca_fusiformis.AAC.2